MNGYEKIVSLQKSREARLKKISKQLKRDWINEHEYPGLVEELKSIDFQQTCEDIDMRLYFCLHQP